MASSLADGRRWIWVGVIVLVGISTWRFGPDLYTIEPIYTDHLKHAYDSWAFLHEGFNIYTEPVVDWNVTARHPHLLWEFWPHPYPIGAVLLFLPFGMLSNLGLMPDLAVHWLMVTLLGVAAVWAAIRFTRYGVVISVFVFISFVHWGLNGFYDPLLAGLAVWAVDRYRHDDWSRTVLLSAVVLSMHYRLWFLAPIAVAAAWKWYRKNGFDWRIALALIIGGVSLATFAMTRSAYATLAGGAGVSLIDHLGAWGPYAAVGFAVVVVAVGWWERSALVVSTVVLAGIVAVTAPQFHGWYPILFTPLFGVVSDPKSRGVLLVAWLHLQFPNILQVTSYYLSGLQ